MTNLPLLPLIRPRLPLARDLLHYLERIDANAYYTNFGPLNKLFLERVTQWQKDQFGREVFGVTTANATLGIELVLADLRLPPKSHILLPALTFIATATAIIRCGHIPVVADVDADTWLLTPESLPKELDLESLGAVVPVASFGMPQNVQAWQTWSERTGVPVIVDAAAAFGAQSSQRNIPTIFSLHATKSLSTGEGGLILTENAEQALRLAQMTNFGIGPLPTVGASNAKLSEYHAAVGHAGLDVWPQVCEQRLSLYSEYSQILSDFCGDSIRFQKDTGLMAPSTMVIEFEYSTCRDKSEQVCDQEGIQTRRWYQPLIQEHPAVSGVLAPFHMPHAKELSHTLLGIPFHLDMNRVDMVRVAAALLTATVHNHLKSR